MASKTNITPKRRINECGDKGLVERKVGKETVLWCKLCDVGINYIRKSSVLQHLDTVSHKRMLLSENSKDIEFPDELTVRNELKNYFTNDLLIALNSIGVRPEEVDNKVFRKCLSKYLKAEVIDCWPTATSLKKQLPTFQASQRDILRNYLLNKKIAVIASELDDAEQRLNIKFMELNAFSDCEPILADTVLLEVFDQSSVSLAIIKCINSYKIEYENVLVFVTNNVSYMKKCYNDVLKNLLTNCHHVICFEQLVDVVGEYLRIHLSNLEAFISSINVMCSKAPTRRRRFYSYLKGNGVEYSNLAFSSDNNNKWNNWLKIALCHVENFDSYKNFIKQERVEKNETDSMFDLDLINEESDGLKEEIMFLKSTSKAIFYNLLKLKEEINSLSCDVYSRFLNIYNEFEIFLKNSSFHRFERVMVSCKSKIESYLFKGEQPAIKVFKALKIFNPHFMQSNDDVDFNELSSELKELKYCLTEIQQYKLSCEELRETIGIKEFWTFKRLELPKLYELAKLFLNFPLSTNYSVEHSLLSKCSDIQDAKRKKKLKTESPIFHNNSSNEFHIKSDCSDDLMEIRVLNNSTDADNEEMANFE